MDPQTNSLGYLSVFLGGLVVSFSPCVFPLIPMTLSFIGVKGSSSRFKGLFLSLVYVSGLAVTYAVLGLVASLTGRIFGQTTAHPLSPFLVGNACIIAGLSFLNVFHIHIKGLSIQHKIKQKGGYVSVFLLGIFAGLIAGPCTAPAVGAILVYVASKQNIFYGASLLFVFAYGMGFLLILTGAFGAAILSLTKSHVWLERMKKVSGFILIGIGEYFILQAGRLLW